MTCPRYPDPPPESWFRTARTHQTHADRANPFRKFDVTEAGHRWLPWIAIAFAVLGLIAAYY